MLDTTLPQVTQSLAHDTGISPSDKITKDATLAGSGDPNATVHFTVDGVAVAATVAADSNGHWTFADTGLLDGTHTIVASETDIAGVEMSDREPTRRYLAAQRRMRSLVDREMTSSSATAEMMHSPAEAVLTPYLLERNTTLSCLRQLPTQHRLLMTLFSTSTTAMI
jgi:hypothetical protein